MGLLHYYICMVPHFDLRLYCFSTVVFQNYATVCHKCGKLVASMHPDNIGYGSQFCQWPQCQDSVHRYLIIRRIVDSFIEKKLFVLRFYKKKLFAFGFAEKK